MLPAQIPWLGTGAGKASGLPPEVWAGRSRACLGLAAAGLLADGRLSGRPRISFMDLHINPSLPGRPQRLVLYDFDPQKCWASR